MKKVLFISNVLLHIESFHVPYLKWLRENGYEVHVMTNAGNKTLDCCDKLYDIDVQRTPFSFKNIPAILKAKKIIDAEKYHIIHSHTPMGGIIGRLASIAARRKGTKVYYTAHGFHFFKGAPLLNWLIYYPIEKICSYFTDILITINQEDYALAKKRMKAKTIEYVPGVGVDTDKFLAVSADRKEKRRQLGIPENAVLMLSVGELNKNKNHEIIIRAIENLDVYYVIAGKGDHDTYLQEVIDSLGLTERVKLLGYRSDVPELCEAADIFAFPSFREGLSVSVMEAMASGLPVACSRIRGNTDLIDENGGVLFNPGSLSECKAAIETLLSSNLAEMGQYNEKKVDRFKVDKVNEQMKELYIS